MFRVIKSLNNNAILALNDDNQAEVIVLGKGIGFGKKVNERFKANQDEKIYELTKSTDRGESHELALSIEPVILEITGSIVSEASKRLGELDTDVLLPLADHITFAVKRIKNLKFVENPVTEDIKTIFAEEFDVARYGGQLIYKKLGVKFNDDELSYIAIHIHGARDSRKVSAVMQEMELIRKCIDYIKAQMHVEMEDSSLAVSRLLAHMKYMFVRMQRGEKINLNMNEYISANCPETYALAKELCDMIANETKLYCSEEETGYLAIHIERICASQSKEVIEKI